MLGLVDVDIEEAEKRIAELAIEVIEALDGKIEFDGVDKIFIVLLGSTCYEKYRN